MRGRDVKVKALVLKDQSAKCKVSLWRDLSSTPVSVGQHVRITDVVVQSYNYDKSLSTTSRTQIEVNIFLLAKIMLRNLRDSLKYSKKVIHSNIEASKLKICFIKQLFFVGFLRLLTHQQNRTQ